MKRVVVSTNQRVESKDFNDIGEYSNDNLFKAIKFSLTSPVASTISGVPPTKAIVNGLAVVPDRAPGSTGRIVYVQAGVFTMPNGLGILDVDQPFNVAANPGPGQRFDVIVAKLSEVAEDSRQRTFINTTVNPPTATTLTHASIRRLAPQIIYKPNTTTVAPDELEIAKISVPANALQILDSNITQADTRRRSVFTTDTSLSTSPWDTAPANPTGLQLTLSNSNAYAPNDPVIPMIIPPDHVGIIFHEFTITRNLSWTSSYQYLPSFNIQSRLEEFQSPSTTYGNWRGGRRFYTVPSTQGFTDVNQQSFIISGVDVVDYVVDPTNPNNIRRFRPVFDVIAIGSTLNQSNVTVPEPIIKANIKTFASNIVALVLPKFS